MNARSIVGIAAAAWMGGASFAVRAMPAADTGQGTTSAWSGVYSADQAQRGATVYRDACGSCHGEKLEGANGSPSLAGADFLKSWNDLTVADLFDRIASTMPQDRPGTLTPAQNADVIAHILSVNTFPTGATDLPSTVLDLKLIRIEMTKPPM